MIESTLSCQVGLAAGHMGAATSSDASVRAGAETLSARRKIFMGPPDEWRSVYSGRARLLAFMFIKRDALAAHAPSRSGNCLQGHSGSWRASGTPGCADR